MPKQVRAARHYQKPDDQARALADRGYGSIKRAVKEALGKLGDLVPRDRAIAHARSGNWHGLRAEIDWNHAREVFKAVFSRIAKVRQLGGELGARKINGAFGQAQRPVRYRKAGGMVAAAAETRTGELPIGLGKYSEDQPRDEHGRWTAGGGSGGASGKSEMTVGSKKVEVELSPASRAAGEQLVEVDTAAVDTAWEKDKDFYVGPGGTVENFGQTEISGRYQRFEDYLATHNSMQASEFGVQSDGRVGFINGRHRFAVLRDKGVSRMVVAMDQDSIRNAERHGYLAKVAKDIGDAFSFDLYDEATLRRIRAEQDRLITMMDDGARGAIEVIIANAAKSGAGPDDIVDYIRGLIGLNDRQAQAVMNYEQGLIDDGSFSDSQISDLVDGYVQQSLDYRAGMIAQTESTRAANAGLHDAYAQAIDRGAFPTEAVKRYWQLGPDPCPICESIPDNEPDGVSVDDTFSSDDGEVDDPPVHPNCQCSVEYVTDVDLVPE